MRRSKAFTLIELIVVAGIISILASIAVVNMQDAQTRAKVSRSQADMYSLAVGIESYAVDHNRYPPNLPIFAGMRSGDQSCFDYETDVHLLRSPSTLPPSITTPIAYLTSRPEQPYPLRMFTAPLLPSRSYFYFSIFAARTPTIGESQDCASYTSPVEMDASFEESFGLWVLWGTGPDMMDWIAVDDFNKPLRPYTTLVTKPLHAPWGYSYHVPYDPTNGTVSFGNVFRTQLSVNKATLLARSNDGGRGQPGPAVQPRPASRSGQPYVPLRPGSAQSNSSGGGHRTDRPPSSTSFASNAPVDAVAWPAHTPAATPAAPEQLETEEAAEIAPPPAPEPARSEPTPPPLPFSWLKLLAWILLILGVALLLSYLYLKRRQRLLMALETQAVDNSNVTDSTLSRLPGLYKRTALDLSDAQITDAGAVQLAGITHLEEINLNHTHVGDEGLKYLAELPALHTLNLAHTNVTDDGLKHLADNRRLRVLVLNGASITSASIPALLSMRALRYLDLGDTSITPAEAKRLREGLPHCEVLAGQVMPPTFTPHLFGDHAHAGPLTSHAPASDAATGREK